jgi:hypothetical protein
VAAWVRVLRLQVLMMTRMMMVLDRDGPALQTQTWTVVSRRVGPLKAVVIEIDQLSQAC